MLFERIIVKESGKATASTLRSAARKEKRTPG
jgi:hypothetical protein